MSWRKCWREVRIILVAEIGQLRKYDGAFRSNEQFSAVGEVKSIDDFLRFRLTSYVSNLVTVAVKIIQY